MEAIILVHTKAGLDGIVRHNGWSRDRIGLQVEAVILVHTKADLDGIARHNGWPRDRIGLQVEAVILVHMKAGLDGIARHNGWPRMGWDWITSGTGHPCTYKIRPGLILLHLKR